MSTSIQRERSGSGSPPASKKPRLDINLEEPITIEQLPAEDIELDELDPPVAADDGAEEKTVSAAKPKREKQPKQPKQKKQRRPPPPEPCSSEDVNWRDIVSLLGKTSIDDAIKQGTEYTSPVTLYEEVELVVKDLTSNGESLSILPAPHPPWAVLVPFALPGETIRARIYRHAKLHSYGDLVSVVTPNGTLRDDSRIKCKYFGKCGGCQYQMLSYETQLGLKKRVVEKAYEHFSGLDPSLVPPVQPTIASPKQYGYRTKITPHFDVPPKGKAKPKAKFNGKEASDATNAESGEKDDDATVKKEWELRIGFDQKGRRSVMDIEECPIATDVLNKAYGPAREQVKVKINTYKRGATLLLRDSLAKPVDASQPEIEDKHICITDHKATVRERVGSTLFEFPAGSFFQNNNSILEPLTSYVRDAIFSRPHEVEVEEKERGEKPTHLVDTYCGSGLFSIMLSPYFEHVAGIEIDAGSIRSAKHNLALNGLDKEKDEDKDASSPSSPSIPKHAFHAGKSEAIFASVLSSSKTPFPREKTVVVIDPPRKGCDEAFIDQVVVFKPAVIVYVSCNVHTQARDVGMLLKKMEGGAERYKVESLRGFDLFPQTAHVESVAVLRLVTV